MRENFKELDDKFAAAFKVARVHEELSQEAVADRMREFGFDMSQPVIGKLERGKRRVTIGEAEALSSAVRTSLSALLAGPQYLKLERALSAMKRLRKELQEAANRFQSGQQALALFADGVEREGEMSPFSKEQVEDYVLESLEDVLQELKNDNIADNKARQFRDALDSDGDDGGPTRQLDPESYFERHQAKFGEETNQVADGVAWSAIFGLNATPSDASSDSVDR